MSYGNADNKLDSKMDTMLSYDINILAERHKFILLEDFIIKIAMELQFSPKVLKHVLVVADEIFTNIVVHGYAHKRDDADKAENHIKLELCFDTKEKILSLKFMDTGLAYNPLEVQEPDIHANIKQRAVGGLGIYLVKKLMDSVDYSHEQGTNILRLKKKI